MNPVYLKEDEKNIVVRLTQDDEDAFCELYAIYKKRLLYFATKFVKSKEFAEDVYQDAFIAVWQTRHSINPELPFSSYLYAIVRNKVLNLMRNIDSEEKLKSQILSQAIDYSDETHEKLMENELEKFIAQAMSKLTGRQREIFEMSRNQNLSYKEIASKLNISIATVQEHISASLKILREYLSKNYGVYSGLILILLCLKS